MIGALLQGAGNLKVGGALMASAGLAIAAQRGYGHLDQSFRHKQHSSFTASVDIMGIPQAAMFQMSKLSNAPGLQSAVAAGSAIGAAGGMYAGAKLGAAMKGKFGIAGGILGTLAGAAYGGTKTFGAYNTLATTASDTLQSALKLTNNKANYNRVRVGSGTRSWTKPTMGRRMNPNANGAGGDLVLSMHRIRHKSLI
jgi:hypothetical protein